MPHAIVAVQPPIKRRSGTRPPRPSATPSAASRSSPRRRSSSSGILQHERGASGQCGDCSAYASRRSAVDLCMINQLSPRRSWTHLQHRQGGWLVSGHHSRLALAVELLAHLGSLAPSCLRPAATVLQELELRDRSAPQRLGRSRPGFDGRTRRRALVRAAVHERTDDCHVRKSRPVPQWGRFGAVSPRRCTRGGYCTVHN